MAALVGSCKYSCCKGSHQLAAAFEPHLEEHSSEALMGSVVEAVVVVAAAAVFVVVVVVAAGVVVAAAAEKNLCLVALDVERDAAWDVVQSWALELDLAAGDEKHAMEKYAQIPQDLPFDHMEIEVVHLQQLNLEDILNELQRQNSLQARHSDEARQLVHSADREVGAFHNPVDTENKQGMG